MMVVAHKTSDEHCHDTNPGHVLRDRDGKCSDVGRVQRIMRVCVCPKTGYLQTNGGLFLFLSLLVGGSCDLV